MRPANEEQRFVAVTAAYPEEGPTLQQLRLPLRQRLQVTAGAVVVPAVLGLANALVAAAASRRWRVVLLVLGPVAFQLLWLLLLLLMVRGAAGVVGLEVHPLTTTWAPGTPAANRH
jgi:hypothetical protein